MLFGIRWTIRALKQAKKLPAADRRRIVAAVGSLANWPVARQNSSVRPLKNHKHEYRLRVGRYRVLFDIRTELKIVSVEEVKKRDNRTY